MAETHIVKPGVQIRLEEHVRRQVLTRMLAEPPTFQTKLRTYIDDLNNYKNSMLEHFERDISTPLAGIIRGNAVHLVDDIIKLLDEWQENTPQNLLRAQLNKIIAGFHNVPMSSYEREVRDIFLKEIGNIKDRISEVFTGIAQPARQMATAETDCIP